jgi:hypothetical protein
MFAGSEMVRKYIHALLAQVLRRPPAAQPAAYAPTAVAVVCVVVAFVQVTVVVAVAVLAGVKWLGLRLRPRLRTKG